MLQLDEINFPELPALNSSLKFKCSPRHIKRKRHKKSIGNPSDSLLITDFPDLHVNHQSFAEQSDEDLPLIQYVNRTNTYYSAATAPKIISSSSSEVSMINNSIKRKKKQRSKVNDRLKKQKHRESVKKFNIQNPLAQKEAVKKYITKNPEKNRETSKKYSDKNPQIHREAVKNTM